MRRRLFATLMLATGMLFAAPAAALADGITMNGTPTGGTVTVDDTTNTITVSGNATMSGTGNAFAIDSDATLEFEAGATLTLTNYTNAFVVSNATLSGGGWNITDGGGMDLFRLKTGGKLNIDDDVTLTGNGTGAATGTAAASRAIVLESGSGQEITLAGDATLAASDFYRGMETGGASGYTLSGQNRETSIFDFSDNDCGMALSYFDSNATYENCKLEVSDCLTSGIFMRQDNAALAGLTIDNVWINCANDVSKFGADGQADIAIRFHSNDFTIKDSKINIQNAWNTGLWICDGWNANEQNEILNTEITVKNVAAKADMALYGTVNRRKAITFVPYRDWLISGSQIVMEGLPGEDGQMDGGLNIASDIKVNRNGLSFSAKASMFGGTVKLANTEVSTKYLTYADIGVQIGQFLEIGENTVINNDHSQSDWTPHYTILCDNPNNGYQGQLFGIPITIEYDTTNLVGNQASPDRVEVLGGSYWSTREELTYEGQESVDVYDASVPNNAAGDELEMLTITPVDYETYFDGGSIWIVDSEGTSYEYKASSASSDGNRYIWVPAGFELTLD